MHQDPRIDKLLTQLLDELCTWERSTGRVNTLVLIPQATDEEIILAQSGKPQYDATNEDVALAVASAFGKRDPALADRLRKAAFA